MTDFILGVTASILAAILGYICTQHLWPIFRNRALYRGIHIQGTWEIFEQRREKQLLVGKIQLRQVGNNVSGQSARTRTRDGKISNREFLYKGSILGSQVTLFFEDKKGAGFDTGAYVFIVQNDGNTMIGMATFHGKVENRIISEDRILKKTID
jgi:hypothetical protein